MESASSAKALLEGPRGRELSLEIARSASPSHPAEFYDTRRLLPPGLSRNAERVLRMLTSVPEDLAISAAELHKCLARVVRRAVYWRPPDEISRLLAEPEVREALIPAAAAAMRSAGSDWWTQPSAPLQHYVQWIGSNVVQGTGEVSLSGARDKLKQWHGAILVQRTNAPVAAGWTGRWWSGPALVGLPITTSALPGSGPAGLSLVEDPLAWRQARTFPLRARSGARIYEIDSPARWEELVRRYPLDVTLPRRAAWSKAAGTPEAETWFWRIPDWVAVSEDFDGVHLTVQAYLRTAGSVVGTSYEKTMLAGWAPGETWWLTDILEAAGEPTDWQAAEGNEGWQVQRR